MALILTQRIKDGPIHFIDEVTGKKLAELKLIGTGERTCRYAITASDDVKILRDSIYQQELRENNHD